MRIGNRPVEELIDLVGRSENYAAIAKAMRVHRRPLDVLFREFVLPGSYPCERQIHTPLGTRSLRLAHPGDLSTLNLVFCREDYLAPSPLRVVVDIGSNIGISGLYWLTRNDSSVVYLHEPVPRNVALLRENLAGFESRYELAVQAVGPERGTVSFGLEETGKLGGITLESEQRIEVEAVQVMDVLLPVLERHGFIDCLKIDVEGLERELLAAIDPELLAKIHVVNVDSRTVADCLPDSFTHDLRGSATRLVNTDFQRP